MLSVLALVKVMSKKIKIEGVYVHFKEKNRNASKIDLFDLHIMYIY